MGPRAPRAEATLSQPPTTADLDIFLAAPPGLEPLVADEAAELGFADPRVVAGGVVVRGDWPEVWRANLALRGPGRVLVRIGAFYAVHLAQLDKRARRLDWARVLGPGAGARVDAACQGSRIYHAGAAAERVARAAADAVGAPVSTGGDAKAASAGAGASGAAGAGADSGDVSAEGAGAGGLSAEGAGAGGLSAEGAGAGGLSAEGADGGAAADGDPGGVSAAGADAGGAAPIRILVRIVDDFCTVSLDTSGEPLHKRGAKLAVGKAPLRETLAALMLRACGYRGTEPVVDPMCGSGTLILEAAEIARGLAPGRARGFAFERLAGFDPGAWAGLRAGAPRPAPPWFLGLDRDAGAVAMARANAARAGVADMAAFHTQAIGALTPPPGWPPGLIIVNPPYGTRIGDAHDLRALYATFGRVVRQGFAGWRVGLITSEPALAHATGLTWTTTGPPVPHGPLRIRLYQTGPL